MLWFWDSCKSVCFAGCLWALSDHQISGDGPLKNLQVHYKSIHIHKSNCKSNRSQTVSKYSPAVFYCSHVRAPASMALLLFIQDYAVRVGFPNNCIWLFPKVMEEAFNFINLTSLLLKWMSCGFLQHIRYKANRITCDYGVREPLKKIIN